MLDIINNLRTGYLFMALMEIMNSNGLINKIKERNFVSV